MKSTPSMIATGEALAAAEAPANAGVFIGLFAAAGLVFATAQPGLAASAAFAGFASAMAAGMALIAVHDDAEGVFHASMRSVVRVLSPLTFASLLWVGIVCAQMIAGAGALATALAIPAFLGLVAAESLFAAGLQFGLSRLAGSDPGPSVALLIADKYAGFAGELR